MFVFAKFSQISENMILTYIKKFHEKNGPNSPN
jgi:hypothetical protein